MGNPQLGVLLPTREAAVTGSNDARELLGFAQAAEELGFDSIWAGDSLTARPRLEPLTLLAAVAAQCPGTTVGTAALTGALRHPLLVAHQIATLDRIAEGRTILGLGAGFPFDETRAEFETVGVPFDRRIGLLMETVAVWRRLWDPERDPSAPLAFEGRYFKFDGIEGLPLPQQSGGPPLWLAGAGPSSLRNAARHLDGWLPYPPSAKDYRAGLETLEKEAADAGRDLSSFTPAMYLTINLQGDAGAARTELEDYCTRYYGIPLEAMATLQAFYAGDIAGCVEWIKGYVEAGARHVIVRFGSFDSMTQLDRAAEDLLPALR